MLPFFPSLKPSLLMCLSNDLPPTNNQQIEEEELQQMEKDHKRLRQEMTYGEVMGAIVPLGMELPNVDESSRDSDEEEESEAGTSSMSSGLSESVQDAAERFVADDPQAQHMEQAVDGQPEAQHLMNLQRQHTPVQFHLVQHLHDERSNGTNSSDLEE